MEDNVGAAKPAEGYAHSTLSHHIVNDLAIARYDPDREVSETICRVRTDLCKSINASTKTIVVENIDNSEPVTNFRDYFKDASYIAKYFRIKAMTGANGVARHYTTCNAMRPDLYQALINALKPAGDEAQAPVDD